MTPPLPDPAFRWTREPWGHALRCVPLEPLAQHLFTTRQLLLRPPQAPGEAPTTDGPQRGQPSSSAWDAALLSVGAARGRLMRVEQVHGAVVRVLARSRVPDTAALEQPPGDAIVSNQPGLALAVMVADCVPILVASPQGGVAAAIHAGWRGTCAGIAGAAVGAMVEACGADPASMIAALGPSIGPDDYEVGESVMAAFVDAGHPRGSVDRWFRRAEGRLRLDLWSANREQLVAAGLRADRVFSCGLSTSAHPGVFDSYRRDGSRAGRMAAVVVVPGALDI